MKKFTLLYSLLFLAVNISYGQFDNIWFFGDHGGLEFYSGQPNPLYGSDMYTYEGSAVMSDNNGDLLFYTNGESIWNKEHGILGSNIGGNVSATQSAVIIPQPGIFQHFYVFTLTDAAGSQGLRYTEIDMSANGGLGGVINSNQQLASVLCEKIVACYHSNGTDIWVIVHEFGSNKFLSYLITEDGVNNNPVVSEAGMIIDGTYGEFTGSMAISPNSEKLAVASFYLGVELLHFDNNTGSISDPVLLSDNWGQNYGVEFSPNSNVLYATMDQSLYQFDLTDYGAVSKTLIYGPSSTFGAMKLGPDSKIYVVPSMGLSKLSVINSPDVLGTGCNYVDRSVDISGVTAWGLSSFFSVPFYILDIDSAELCKNKVSFNLNVTTAVDEIIWDFGDGNTSQELNPEHEYETSGLYIIKVKAIQNDIIRYFRKEVWVSDSNIECIEEIKIPKGISPNDDNLNDIFDLSGYNVAMISIYNRYGLKVYSKHNYKDEWFGQNDLGKELPTGVYYYNILFGEGDSKTGWIYLAR